MTKNEKNGLLIAMATIAMRSGVKVSELNLHGAKGVAVALEASNHGVDMQVAQVAVEDIVSGRLKASNLV